MIDKKDNLSTHDRVVLVGMIQKDQTETQVTEYMDELAFLAETAGCETIKRFTQKMQTPDSKTYIGKGKLEEIKTFVILKGITLAIFDDELTGSQINNISDAIGIKVIDRSDLILDIFASRARTAQAKVQVELAQYQYLLPRLKGMWKHLGQTFGER
jgi:GTPase